MLPCKIDRLQEQMKSTRTKQTECKLFFLSILLQCHVILLTLHYDKNYSTYANCKSFSKYIILNNMSAEATLCLVPVVANFSYIAKLCYYSVVVFVYFIYSHRQLHRKRNTFIAGWKRYENCNRNNKPNALFVSNVTCILTTQFGII
jgi:hypothetical protein